MSAKIIDYRGATRDQKSASTASPCPSRAEALAALRRAVDELDGYAGVIFDCETVRGDLDSMEPAARADYERVARLVVEARIAIDRLERDYR